MAECVSSIPPFPNNGVCRMLIVSTEHLCESTCALLESESLDKSSQLALTVARYGDYGWFMWAPTDPEMTGGMPADLCYVLTYARQNGCHYVLIDMDADAEAHPALPLYPNL